MGLLFGCKIKMSLQRVRLFTMKIIELNAVDNRILKFSKEVADQHFKNLDATIWLYQSQEYDEGITLSGSKIPACFVPGEDVEIQASNCKALEEILKCFEGDVKQIIWFSKNVNERPDLKRLVAHEIKHFEQYTTTDRLTLCRDRILDCFFSVAAESSEMRTPSEIDADNFARMGAGYSWTEEVDKLYATNREEIESLYEKTKGRREVFIDKNGQKAIYLPAAGKAIFRHYFERCRRLKNVD